MIILNPLLYVSRPSLEIKNKYIKPIENKLINQLDELYQAGRRVICEIKTNKGILNGIIRKKNEMISIVTDDEEISFNYADIIEINVLKINGL